MRIKSVAHKFWLWLKLFGGVISNSNYKPMTLLHDFESGDEFILITTMVLCKDGEYNVLLRSLSSGQFSLVPYDEYQGNLKSGKLYNIRLTDREIERKLSVNSVMHDMIMNGTRASATFGGDMAVVLASGFTDILRQHAAENYVELRMFSPQLEQQIIVTIQKSLGKTPHQLRREAEGKAREAEEQVKELTRKLGPVF